MKIRFSCKLKTISILETAFNLAVLSAIYAYKNNQHFSIHIETL